MKVRAVVSLLVLVPALALTVRASDDAKEARKEAGKSAGLDQFKQLEGEWVGKEVEGHNPGQEVHTTYKVTSAGSTVLETMFPGTDHEMLTVIHPDGDDLILTHYCALGNQPRMKAEGGAQGNKVAFKFASCTNLKSDKDPHMHDVTFTFVDKDTLKEEWTHYQDGKSGGTVVFELKRKK